MESLCFLPEERTVYQVQICHFSNKNLTEKYFNHFVLLKVNGKIGSYLCKVGVHHFQNLTNCCYINSSVVVYSSDNDLKLKVPLVDLLNGELDTIRIENIQMLPEPNASKSIEISVVFKDIDGVLHWKNRSSALLSNVREILRLFVFLQNSVIFLSDVEDFVSSDIYCIVVHSVSTGSNNEPNQTYKVNTATKVNIFKTLSCEKFTIMQELACNKMRLKGLDNVRKKLIEVVSLCRSDKDEHLLSCKQVLLTGPPGSGKTTLVHQISSEFGYILLKILGPEVICPLPGDTEKELHHVFEQAKKYAENDEACIILLDEVDTLVPAVHKAEAHTKRIAVKLFKLLEEVSLLPRIVVIATTNKSELIDSRIFRPGRLSEEILISVPSEQNRKDILSGILETYGFPSSDDIISNISKWTNGYVGADLTLLVQDVYLTLQNKKVSCTSLSIHDLSQIFKDAVGKMSPATQRATTGVISKTGVKLSDIGGLNSIKQTLYVSVILPLLHPESFERLGIPQLKGILLYGPPGCAKTTLVKALANEVEMTFVCISAAELYSAYVGETEKRISQLFKQARLCAPTILFIDEIDSIVGARGTAKEEKVHDRVLSTLLVEIDGVGIKLEESHQNCENSQIIIIGATNRPDNIDEALKRPGRFDKLLYVPPPDKHDRLEILKKITEKMPLDESVDLEIIAEQTEYYSGADLRNLCMESGLLALTENCMNVDNVSGEHFIKVLKGYKPSLTKNQIEVYNRFSK